MNNTGWICPRCNSVFAPFMWECTHCKTKLNETLVTEKFQVTEAPKCIHEWDTSQILASIPPKVRCKKCYEFWDYATATTTVINS